MHLKNIIGTITLDTRYLQSAALEELEILANCQTEFGRALSKILESNKMSPKISIYTTRAEGSSNITVTFVREVPLGGE